MYVPEPCGDAARSAHMLIGVTGAEGELGLLPTGPGDQTSPEPILEALKRRRRRGTGEGGVQVREGYR